MLLLWLVAPTAEASARRAEGQGAREAFSAEPVRLPPFFWYEPDPAHDREFWMSLLLYWYGREGRDYYRLLVPFYFSARQQVGEAGEEERFRILFPFAVWFHTAQSRLTLIGPWYARHRGDRSTHAFFPLYWRFRHADRFTTVIPPVFVQGGRTRLGLGVFPLFWHVRTRETHTTLLFPVFYDDRTERTRTLVSLPVWYFRRPHATTGVIPPWFWRRTPDRSTQVLFPLYWRFANPEGQTIVAPPFYALTASDQQTLGVFPLFHRQVSPGSGFQFLFPLYALSYDQPARRRFLTLFASRRRNGGETSGHVGLYYYRREEPWARLKPDLNSPRDRGERTDGLFPLFHWSRSSAGFTWWSGPWYWERDEGYRRHWLFPVYFYEGELGGEGGFGHERQFISPLLWYKQEGPDRRGLIPLYYWSRTPEAERDVWFPLVWRFRNREERRATTVIPPLAWWSHAPDRATRVIAPLFFQTRRGATRLTIVPPFMDVRSGEHHAFSAFFLWWRNRTAHHSVTALWPLFGFSARGDSQQFLSPLVWYRRSGATRRGIVPPYYWRRGPSGTQDVVFPLLWRFDRQGEDNTWSRLLLIPPFYRYARPNVTRLGVFPLAHRGDTATTTERIFLPWFWHTRTRHGSIEESHRWYPLFLSGGRRTSDQDKFLSASGRVLLLYGWDRHTAGWSHSLFPVYAYRHHKDEVRFMAPSLLPLVYYQRRPDLVRRVIVPYYHQRREDARIDIVFPIYWRWGDREDQRTVVPPVYRHTAPEGGSTVVFPLAWYQRRGDAVRSAMIPLWYAHRDPQAAASTLMTPLYWSVRDGTTAWGWAGLYAWFKSPGVRGEPDERTHLLFPLYWQSRSAEGRLHVIFPFWWDRSRAQGAYRLSAAPPLYYRWVTPKRTTHFVFPLYWRSRSQLGTLTIVPPIYTASSQGNGERTRTFGVMPLFSQTIRGTTYRYVQILGRLFAYQRVGDRVRYTYLFVFHTR